MGMEIASAGTDGDRYRVHRGRLRTDLNFTGTDGDGINVRPRAGLYCKPHPLKANFLMNTLM